LDLETNDGTFAKDIWKENFKKNNWPNTREVTPIE